MPESRRDSRRDFDREEREQELVHRVLSNTTDLPAKFKDWITRWVESSGARLSVNDSIGTYNQPRARVYNSATQSVSNNTITTLTFNSELYDTGAMHDTSTNTSRLTAAKPGVYSIGGHLEWAANSTGQRGLYLYLNGATYIGYVIHDASAANETTLNIVTEYALNAGDYVEMRGFQNSGGSLNASGTGVYGCSFFMSFVADYPRSN